MSRGVLNDNDGIKPSTRVGGLEPVATVRGRCEVKRHRRKKNNRCSEFQRRKTAGSLDDLINGIAEGDLGREGHTLVK